MNQQRKGSGNKALKCLELCAGAGGAALGFERAGFTHVALLENDPHACATLRLNRPYWNVIEADIRHFNASYWRGVELLSGGLPCPPFSIASKQLGVEDERNLFPPMLRIVREVRPRAVVIENVRGILSIRMKKTGRVVERKLTKATQDAIMVYLRTAPKGPFLFPGESVDSPLSRRTLHRIFKRHLRSLFGDGVSLQGSSTHTMRRSVAALVADNRDIQSAAYFLGHTSIANTIRYLDRKKMALNVDSLMQEIDL